MDDDKETVEKVYPLPTDLAIRIIDACRRRIAENEKLQAGVLRDLMAGEAEPPFKMNINP